VNAIRTISSDELKQLGNRGFALAFQILGHREDAADAVQDSLHQLYRQHKRFDAKRGNIQAWFLTIVRNRSIDIRRKSKIRSGDNEHPVADSKTSNPDQSAEQNELIEIVTQKLGQLPEDLREIIMLRDFHDLSYAEIAHLLGIASGTVMSRLHRARQALRAQVLDKKISEQE
jgi:RNA polymerase sigma-70 factor (ECF subfamily)